MNYFDIGAGIIILWSAWKGFSSGFIVSVLSLAGLIAGVYVALYFSGFARDLLADNFNLNGMYLKTAAFAVTFLGVVIAIHLVARVLEKVLTAAALGPANKMAGAAFGIFKGALIVSVILMVINTFSSPGWMNDEVYQDSVICMPSSRVAPWFISLVKDEDLIRFIPSVPDDDKEEKPAEPQQNSTD